MRYLRSYMLFFVLIISFSMCTGFFGGESPEDAINDVIKAIENNDGEAFKKRVTVEYWVSTLILPGQSPTDVAWTKSFITPLAQSQVGQDGVNVNSNILQQMKNLGKIKDRNTQLKEMSFIFREASKHSIESGIFANLCRSEKTLALPFIPEALKQAQYLEEKDGIAIVTVSMADGQQTSIGLGEIEDTWYIFSVGGNPKAAKDAATEMREFRAKKLAEVREHKKKMDAFYDEIRPQYVEFNALLEKNDHEKALDLYLALHSPLFSLKTAKLQFTGQTSLTDPTLWDELAQAIAKKAEVDKSKALTFLKENHQKLQDYAKRQITGTPHKLLWKSDNVMLVEYYRLRDPKTGEFTTSLNKEKWLNGEYVDSACSVSYRLFHKRNGLWVSCMSSYQNAYSGIYMVPPFMQQNEKYPFTTKEYMLALAKDYEAILEKVEETKKNLVQWEEEVRNVLVALGSGEFAAFEKHVDLASFLRDNGNATQTAAAIAAYEGNDGDIKNFLDYVRTTGNGGTQFSSAQNAQISDVSRLHAEVKLPNDEGVFAFRRDDIQSPWKLYRYGKKQSDLKRSANWEDTLARHLDSERKKIASEACVASILDMVVVEDGLYGAYYKDYDNLEMKGMFLARNTSTTPIKVDSWCIYFVDAKTGKLLLTKRNAFSYKNQVLNPDSAEKLSYTVALTDKELYLLEQTKEGKVHCFVRPYSATINEKTYMRFDPRRNVTKLEDGRWQLDDFAPITIDAPLLTMTPDEEKAFNVRCRERAELNGRKSTELIEAILDTPTVEYNAAKNTIVLHNKLNDGLRSVLVLLSVYDQNNVKVGGKELSFTPKPNPLKSKQSQAFTIKDKDFKAPQNCTVVPRIISMTTENARYTRGEVWLACGAVHPRLYHDLKAPLILIRQAEAEKSKTANAVDEETKKNLVQWEEEVRNVLVSLGSGDIAAFEKHVDLASFLRDNGNAKDFAKAIFDNEESNADINAFLEHVRKNKNGGANLVSIDTAQVVSVTKQQAIVKSQDWKRYYLLKRENETAPWVLTLCATSEAGLLRPATWDANVQSNIETLRAQYLAEKQRQEKILFDASQSMNSIKEMLLESFAEKNPLLALQYIDLVAMEVCPKVQDSVTQGAYIENRLKHSLAPARARTLEFSNAVESGTPWPSLAVLWNAEAWSKAQYSLVPHSDTAVIVSLPGEKGLEYLLFAKCAAEYKLIASPTTDKELLEKHGAPYEKMWTALIANYVPRQGVQEFLQFADLLRHKQGKELAAQIDIPYVFIGLPNNDNFQAYMDLRFAEQHNKAIEKRFEEEVNHSGAFTFKEFALTASQLEQGWLTVLDNNLTSVQVQNREYIFRKSDDKAVLIGVFDLLEANIRNQLAKIYSKRNQKLGQELHRMASQECIAAFLDILLIEEAQYTVFQEKNSIVMKIPFTVKNASNKNITTNNWALYFTDNKTNKVFDKVFTASKQTMAPNEVLRFDCKFNLSEEDMYLLQQVQEGNMRLTLGAHSVSLGRQSVKRFDEGEARNVKYIKGGLWQWMDLEPTALKQQSIPCSNEDRKILKEKVRDFVAKNGNTALEIVKNLFASIKVTADVSKQTLLITNTSRYNIGNIRLNLIVYDKNNIRVANKESGENCNANLNPQEHKEVKFNAKKLKLQSGETIQAVIVSAVVNGVKLDAGKNNLLSGVVSPLILGNTDAVLYSFTQEELNKKTAPQEDVATPVQSGEDATPSQETSQTPVPETAQSPEPAQSPVPEATPSPETAQSPEPAQTEANAALATTGLELSAQKQNGKAVLVPTEQDVMGFTSFGNDKNADSIIRALVSNASPLKAIRVDTIGGMAGSWKTKDVTTDAMGILAVQENGTVLNPDNASFELNVEKPTVVELVLQDNGALADTQTRIRITFFYSDGSRSYSVLSR